MKVLRVRRGNVTFYGQLLLEESAVRCLDQAMGLDDPVPLAELQVLPPVSPSKVVCAGGNFRSRLLELGRDPADAPMLFFKPPSAVIGSGQPIVLPRQAQRVEAGAALAVVIGRACRNVPPEEVPQRLFGYSCANDVTALGLPGPDPFWVRSKGYDTFAPIGPWIETAVADLAGLTLRLRVNDRLVQEAGAADMALAPLELVSLVSSVMTLLPGDVILAGSPAGGGELAPGDEVRVEIDGVGVLINGAQAEPGSGLLQ